MAEPLSDRVLRLLLTADPGGLSGQELARRLGVTRSAVWKAVEELREAGYEVESRAGRGYRLHRAWRGLRPPEVEACLATARLGRPVRYLARTGSTNAEADRWAEEGAPEGALVVAEHQDRGRGRRGRSWADLPGRSLLFSLILRPPLPAAAVPPLTYVASAALAEALAAWAPRQSIEIKWPNDVLLGGRKVAGILLEMRAEAQAARHVVLGVGVNVGGAPDDLPEEVRALATTLAAWAAPPPPDRLAVLCGFLQALEPLYDRFVSHGFGAVREAWTRWFRAADRRVRVHTPSGPVEGTAVGLDDAGALLLEAPDGTTRRILAGDLHYATTRAP
ncbi:biotin--[acetyl-CoA-carboxylase] ligase [Deferrisoma camini]|uniref:biotin--[acetyl-CoA-carboxylase] ligase n=1 Tax=Deferrisoma camini TaxID=1035120 RepID=UPI00046D556F|nr:biotin--[acetyl-CoA-carboxylase] ligase [Deferrisoma camini]